MGRPIAMIDPKAISRMTIAAMIPTSSPVRGCGLLEGEEEIAAGLDLQRRAGAGLGDGGLEAVQVGGR